MRIKWLHSMLLLTVLLGLISPAQAAPPVTAALLTGTPQPRVIPTPERVYNAPFVPYLPLPSPDGQHLYRDC